MYCRNCGQTLPKGSTQCTACFYQLGKGTRYCQYCGNQVEPGQEFCTLCGNSTAEVQLDQKKGIRERALAYKGEFTKLTILNLIQMASSLVLILCLLFLPIYRCEYNLELRELADDYYYDSYNGYYDESYNEYQAYESAVKEAREMLKDGELTSAQFSSLMSNGHVYIEKNFSAFEDFIRCIDLTFSDSDSDFAALGFFFSGLFLIFEIIFSIIFAITATIAIVNCIKGLCNMEDNCILTYTQIEKLGEQGHKVGFFKRQTALTIALYALFDVFFGRFVDGLIPIGPAASRYMASLTGVSGFIAVIAFVGIGIIVAKIMWGSTFKNVVLNMAKNEK